MKPLTPKQQRVLEFITSRLEESNPPSQREIANHFGLAQNAAYQLVRYLRRKGYVVDVKDVANQFDGVQISAAVAMPDEYAGEYQRFSGDEERERRGDGARAGDGVLGHGGLLPRYFTAPTVNPAMKRSRNRL